MLLKNLMEDKQLDFNRPLLSVRRFTSPVTTSESEGNKKTDKSLPMVPRLPTYKSELKSGPIRNPGTVPFVWEKTPGRPKQEHNVQTHALERPPIAPKPPPGRVSNNKKQSLRKGSDGKSFAPSQTECVFSRSQNFPSSPLDETKCKPRNGDEEMEETRSSGSKDSEEAYVDALDTLSRTESFFLNCSVSGVSGLDGPDIMPSGIFSADPQTQDFMMGRFLPAAKAVASETPPYATRKQLIARELPREIKKVITVDKRQPFYGSSPNKFTNHAQDDWCEESEDQGDDSQSQASSANVCGLFPQSSIKNSFCLLNPIPGMKIQAHKPVKSAYSVRRRHTTPSYLRCSVSEIEHGEAVGEKGLMGIAQTEELIGKKNNQSSRSSQRSYTSDCLKAGGLQANDACSDPSQISQFAHQEKGFLGILDKAKCYRISGIGQLEKGSNNFEELLAGERISQESGSASPVAEKTLYLDFVCQVKPSDSYSSNEMKITHSTEDELEIPVKPGEMKEIPSVDSTLLDIKHLNGMIDEQHKRVESVEPCFKFSPETYALDVQMDATNCFRRDQDLIQESSKLALLNVTDNGKGDTKSESSYQQTSHGLVQASHTFTNSKVSERRKVDLESHLQLKLNKEESYNITHMKIPLGPPLPKAPSESWLNRTLPIVSSKNLPSRSYLGMHSYTGTQPSRGPFGDPKWETMVKSSNVHHGYLQFSEEQLPTIPEA